MRFHFFFAFFGFVLHIILQAHGPWPMAHMWFDWDFVGVILVFIFVCHPMNLNEHYIINIYIMGRIFVVVIISIIWGQPCANRMHQLMLSMFIFIFIQNYRQICCHNCTKMNGERICKKGDKKDWFKSNKTFIVYLCFCMVWLLLLHYSKVSASNGKELLKMSGNINSNKRCKKGENKINKQYSQIAAKCRTQIHNAITGHSNSCSPKNYDFYAYHTLLSKNGASIKKKNGPQKSNPIEK